MSFLKMKNMEERIHESDPQAYPMRPWVMERPDFGTVRKTSHPMEGEDGSHGSGSERSDPGPHTAMRVFPAVGKEANRWGMPAVFGNPKHFKPSVPAHEASHARDRPFEPVGINRGKFDDGEPAAYPIQRAFGQLYNARKGKA